MPNDLSVKAVGPVSGASENPAEQQTTPFVLPVHAPAAQHASPLPNPQMRLDPALGLVVIEFRDDSGAVTTSIPSQRQLDAYRMWEQGRSGHHADPQPKHHTGFAEQPHSGPNPPAVHTSATDQR